MDDLISRREAIDALDEQIKFCDNALCDFNISLKDEYAVKVERASLCAYKEILEDLSSAQQSGRKGKWNTYYHSDIDFSHSCNQCGYSAPYQMIGGGVFQKKWNFCPNCGADMRGDNDDQSKR